MTDTEHPHAHGTPLPEPQVPSTHAAHPPLEPGNLPEIPQPTPDETPYVNDNLYFNRLGAAQGVAFGSWDPWYLGGAATMYGSSGQAACDGWTHAHKFAWNKRREAVIANLCDTRRFFYTGAPHRKYGPPYPPAGRPDGWKPEIVGNTDPALRWDDNPDGSVTRPRAHDGMPVQVTGPDCEHTWITHLIPLVDDPSPVMLDAPYDHKVASNLIAEVLVNYVARSIAGQIRDPLDPVLPLANGVFGDRANSRILDTYIDAAIRPRCIEMLDATTLDLWMRDVMTPFYEGGAGIHEFRKNGDPYNEFIIGVFNGLGWILPVCYRAAEVMPASSIKDRLMLLVQRWSNWLLEIEMKWPGKGLSMSRVRVDRKVMMQGPHFSLGDVGLLDTATADFSGGGWWEGYTFYALAVAARITESPVLDAEYERKKALFAKTMTEPEHKVWLVDADRKPI